MVDKIFDVIEVVEPFPAVYIRSLNMLVITDLHLGYETAAVEEGMFIPKIQYKKTVKDLELIFKKYNSPRFLINGDVKHEFSETSYHEYKEVSDFFEFIKQFSDDIIVVKGNHDTFIARITKKYGINLYDEYAEEDFLFIHGHKNLDLGEIRQQYIILGHEHPSLALYSELGVKEKIKCFLYGAIDSKNLLVLPAFSYFAQGSDINLIPSDELLSPLLKGINVDSLRAIGVIEGEKCLFFPRIGMLRE